MDQRPVGAGVYSPDAARGQSDCRSARPEGSQLRPRLFLFVRHRHRPVRHDLPDTVVLGRVRGYGALDIGLAVFSTGVFQIMAIPLYAFLANRVDLRWIMMTGLGLFALSDVGFQPDHP